MNIFDTIPTASLFLLFILVVVILSIIGLYIFELILRSLKVKPNCLKNTKTYILVVSTLIGIVLAFIIYNEWQAFYREQINVEEESVALLNLYSMVRTLPGTFKTQQQIIKYIKSIIYVEFSALQKNILVKTNPILNTLRDMIYEYEPKTKRETQLYQETVVSLNRAINLRVARVDSVMNGLAPELWWVVLLGSVINIIMTWFVYGNIYYKVIMTSFVATIFAALLFLLVVLDYPFSGGVRIQSTVFQNVLNNIKISYKL